MTNQVIQPQPVPAKEFVFYDPRLENPPRDGKASINGIELIPNSVTELTSSQYQVLTKSQYGKLLFSLGALKQIKDIKKIQKTSIAMLSLAEAKEAIFSCNNLEQLRQWRKTEQRHELRLLIQDRIRELRELE